MAKRKVEMRMVERFECNQVSMENHSFDNEMERYGIRPWRRAW